MSTPTKFILGAKYTRKEIQQVLGLKPETGGEWFTGYREFKGEWYLFPTIGDAGRTGHNYGNRWIPGGLLWFGRTGAKKHHDTIRSLVSNLSVVYLFARSHDREPFVYYGRLEAIKVVDVVPVEIHWRMLDRESPAGPIEKPMPPLPEQVTDPEKVIEGAKKQITVNAYERDRLARSKCISHWGAQCSVCEMTFPKMYDGLGDGFIHVHHLRSIADVGEEYELDPIADLRPLCPNCHAVVHFESPPMAIDDLRARLGKPPA